MINNSRTIPELLAPAGSFEKLQAIIHYGADAVYLGGKQFSLRAHATNFTDEDLKSAIAYTHAHGVKAYVTLNIFAHHDDLAGLAAYLETLKDMKPDGLIISDPGVLSLARRIAPAIPIHLSTQANVTNRENARFWLEQGIRRLNLARELSLREIKEIRQAVDAELEVFVHGALCISYSGRCMLSHYLTGRSANQGDCAHPCRYLYRLEEEKRPGQFFPVEEDPRGTYIFNAKDLCLLFRLPELIGAGIDSIKIEGRMKSVYYAGATVRLYRAGLDFIAARLAEGMHIADISLPDAFREEMNAIGTRGWSENFFDRQPGANDMLYDSPRLVPATVPVAIIREAGPQPLIEARNPISLGDECLYMDKGLANVPCTVTGMTNEKAGGPVKRANPGDLVRVFTSVVMADWQKHGLLRKKT